MSKARSAATKPAKRERTEGMTVLSGRVDVDDMGSLHVVQQWAQSTLDREVSTSQALRIALRLAAATVSGEADPLADLVEERAAAQSAQQSPLSTDEHQQVLDALRATEEAYRGFDRQVQRVGNNVNQLTLLGHRGEKVDPVAVEGCARALRGILDEMMLWERFDNRERMRLRWDWHRARD